MVSLGTQPVIERAGLVTPRQPVRALKIYPDYRLSGLMSGVWKQGTEKRVRHRQPKGSETDGLLLHYCATLRLYNLGASAIIGGLCHATERPRR